MPPAPAADASSEHPLREAFSWYLLQVYLRTLRESSDRDRLFFARRVVPQADVAEVLLHRIDEVAVAAINASGADKSSSVGDLIHALSQLPRAIEFPEDKWDVTRIRETFSSLLPPADSETPSSPPLDTVEAAVGWLLNNVLARKSVVGATIGLAAELPPELPPFDRANLEVSKQRLSHFCEADVPALVRRVSAIELEVARGGRYGNPQWARDDARYRLAIARELDYVELFGADLSSEASRHGLSVAYVSLNLRNAKTETEGGVAVTVNEMLAQAAKSGSWRILIRGAAGAGKSTLFRWIAMAAAEGGREIVQPESVGLRESVRSGLASGRTLVSEIEEWARSFAAAEQGNVQEGVSQSVLARAIGKLERRIGGPLWTSRTPFLLRLRDCSDGLLSEPEVLFSLLSEGVGKPPAGLVESILTGGQGILLVDGVDEVPPSKRAGVEAWLTKVIARYPGNLILVSTRPEAVPDQWLSEHGFQEAWINPLSERDKREFIDKWHSAVADQARAVGKSTADLATLADELKKKLPSEPGINRLAEVPLLCAMICALHRDRHAKLPESQAELCDALSHVLLHRRERESGLDLAEFPEAYRNLSYEQKRAIVRELAYHMVDNERSVIAEPVATDIVRTLLARFVGQDETQATVVCKSLVERSGMLREALPGQIDFIHNTFKEYLAAERFAETSSVPRLAKQAGEASWQPVLVFAAASRSPDFATRLVRELLKAPRRATKTTPAARRAADAEVRVRQLLALRCRQMAVQLDADLKQELDDVMADLFPPRTMSDADALAVGGQLAVQQLHYDQHQAANVVAASARTLRLIGTPQAREVLDGYRRDMRMSVVNELLNVINPFELARIRQILLGGSHLPIAIARSIDSLAGVETLTDATQLDLSHIPASDLRPLAKLTSLRSLILDDWDAASVINAPGKDLSALAGLSRLEALSLAFVNFRKLQALRTLKHLRSLDLSGADLRNLDSIEAFPKLEELRLSLVNSSPAASKAGMRLDISKVVKHGGLQLLSLTNTPIADAKPLSSLKLLRTLVLGGSNVEDLAAIGALPSLQHLDISHTRPKNLRFVSKLPALRLLVVEGVESDDLSWVQEEAKRRGFEVLGIPRIKRPRKRATLPPADRTPLDVALVIALDEEFSEVQKLFGADWESVPGGALGEVDYRFRRPRASGVGADECIAVLVGEMGPEATAMRVASLLSKYAPKTLVIAGIAGSLSKDVQVGDVVVGELVNLYLANARAVPSPRAADSARGASISKRAKTSRATKATNAAKAANGGGADSGYVFEVAPDPFRPSAQWVNTARHLPFASAAAFGDWTRAGAEDFAVHVPEEKTRARLIRKNMVRQAPRHTVGPIASGPIVGAAETFRDWLLAANRRYAAIEMESGGFLKAVDKYGRGAGAIVIRGISDLSDNRKKELDRIGRGGLRRYAMQNALRYIWLLLDHSLDSTVGGGSSSSSSPSSSSSASRSSGSPGG